MASHSFIQSEAPHLRPPEDFFLPAGYCQQTIAHSRDAGLGDGEYWTQARIASSRVYQFHVYRWASEMITNHGLQSMLDIGSGPGLKLRDHIAPVCSDIECLDQLAGVSAAQRLGSPGMYHSVDLENPSLKPHRSFDLIVSADVIEHLIDPDPMLEMIKGYCHEDTMILLSTPDRSRLHGRECMASTKAEHVREWSADEFTQYLTDRGYAVIEQRFFPADDAPLRIGMEQESMFIMGTAPTSPHRCHTVLCHPTRP